MLSTSYCVRLEFETVLTSIFSFSIDILELYPRAVKQHIVIATIAITAMIVKDFVRLLSSESIVCILLSFVYTLVAKLTTGA